MSISDDLSSPKTTSGPDDVREDQEWLQPTAGVIGWQPQLHGPLGRSVDGFRPTVFELQQLARYWDREWWNIRLFEIYSQSTGSREMRIGPYANRRLNRICEAIGGEAFQEVVDEVRAEIRKRVGEEDWAAITGDDKAAYERLIERIESGLERMHERDGSDGSGPVPSEPPREGEAG